MIVEKLKPSMPYVRPHKTVHKFTVHENLYTIIKYVNTNSYGILITDIETQVSRLYKPFEHMNSLTDVYKALESGQMFKPAQIVKNLNR